MTEPSRQRFVNAGLIVATRSFPGDRRQPLHYGFWREPGEEPFKGWRKGREYFVDLQSGDWSLFGGPWRPFSEFALSGDHEKSTPPAEPGSAAIVSTSLPAAAAPDLAAVAAPAECGSDNSSNPQPEYSARNPFDLDSVPADVRPWLVECANAGFELIDAGGNHCGPGFDTGNRFGVFRGREELLCGRTQRIVDRAFEKWTLEEYLNLRLKESSDGVSGDPIRSHVDRVARVPEVAAAAGQGPSERRDAGPEGLLPRAADGDSLLSLNVAFKVEHPTGPRATKQRGLFA